MLVPERLFAVPSDRITDDKDVRVVCTYTTRRRLRLHVEEGL